MLKQEFSAFSKFSPITRILSCLLDHLDGNENSLNDIITVLKELGTFDGISWSDLTLVSFKKLTEIVDSSMFSVLAFVLIKKKMPECKVHLYSKALSEIFLSLMGNLNKLIQGIEDADLYSYLGAFEGRSELSASAGDVCVFVRNSWRQQIKGAISELSCLISVLK